MNYKYYILLLLTLSLSSCENLFEYNPNEVLVKKSERDLNQKSITKIKALPVKDTLRFIVMGDTQRWYDESVDFVNSANKQKDISFVIHCGDMSDFGISKELKWVNEIMQKLNYPYVAVVGNHDTVANGPLAFTRMYGDLDFSFEVGDNKFIMINTNSREYQFDGSTPNLTWLRNQLHDNPENKNAIVIGHVPPFDADFDPNLQEQYAQILAEDPNVKYTLYGHQHAFKEGEFYNDGVQYHLTTSMNKKGYLVVSTWKGGYKVDKIEF